MNQSITRVVELAKKDGVTISNKTIDTSNKILTYLPDLNAHITYSLENEIVIEKRSHKKEIVFYIKGKEIAYIKVWGSDIYTEMEDGILNTVKELPFLIKWLTD